MTAVRRAVKTMEKAGPGNRKYSSVVRISRRPWRKCVRRWSEHRNLSFLSDAGNILFHRSQEQGLTRNIPFLSKPSGMFAAIFSEVALEDFSGSEGQARMEDLTWIGPRGTASRRGHHGCYGAWPSAARPFRHGLFFPRGHERRNAAKAASEYLVKDFPGETSGKKEWGLRAYVDRPQARSQIMAAAFSCGKRTIRRPSSGKRYFLEQKIKRDSRAGGDLLAQGIGEDIQRIVQKVSDSFNERRPLVAGGDGERTMTCFSTVPFLFPTGTVDVLQGPDSRMEQAS